MATSLAAALPQRARTALARPAGLALAAVARAQSTLGGSGGTSPHARALSTLGGGGGGSGARGPAPPRGTPPPGPPPPPRGIIDANGNVISSRRPPPPAGGAATRPPAGGGGGGGAAARQPPPGPSTIPPESAIMDVTEANFMEAVVQCPVPVVLDVWAGWCQPCKTLTPKLEGIARSAKGAIRLAKVDADACRGLVAQLQVKSLPTVFGIVGGKVVASFQGAVPDGELRSFFEQLMAAGDRTNGPLAKANDAVTTAHAMIDEGRHEDALAQLPAVVETLQKMRDAAEAQLSQAAAAGDKGAETALNAASTSGPLYDLDNLAARAIAGVVRAMTAIATDAVGTSAAAAAGDAGAAAARDPKVLAEEVRTYTDLLKGRYKHHIKHPDVSRALAAGDVLSAAAEHSGQLAPLLAAVEAAPKDAGARFALAEAQLALGQHAPAVDNCLLIVRAEPGWRDGAAKSLLLKVFETLGPSHPVSVDGRKRLSKLLFR